MKISNEDIQKFFAWSDCLDYLVLRPLSHIRDNWETSWDDSENRYRSEEDSFAGELNDTINKIAEQRPPAKYHDNEDRLAEFVRDKMNWKIKKVGNQWVGESVKRLGPDDYAAVMEQGAFDDPEVPNLFLAATGRVHAAILRGQNHFDQMEESHQKMLAAVLANIIYHHECATWQRRQEAGGG